MHEPAESNGGKNLVPDYPDGYFLGPDLTTKLSKNSPSRQSVKPQRSHPVCKR